MRNIKHLTAILALILCANTLSARPVRVLSLDGGGVRGMIGLAIIDKIEKSLGKPASKIFDLIVGSSTGGITALALAVPDSYNQPKFSAQDIMADYQLNAQKIFSASWTHTIRTLGGLLGPKYESFGIEEVIDTYVKNVWLSQALTNVVITGYHIEGQSGVEFSSHDAKQFPSERDCLMGDVGTATSAAPVFFESVDVTFPWGTLSAVVDGALYKHNPVLVAYINAKKLYPGKEIEVYSLGTGRLTTEETSEQLKGRGLLQWLSPILHHLQIASSDADNSFLHKLLNEDGEKNFFRLDVEIDEDHRSMDDTSWENIEYLRDRGVSATFTPQFAEMIDRLR